MGCCRRGEQRKTGKKEKGTRYQETAGSQETASNGRIGYWLQDGDEDDPLPPPAAIASPMTAAVPTAIHPIVPAERPVAVFFPAASPAVAAPLPSAGGFGVTPGSAAFFGHVSNVSAATARETDPRLTVRTQAAQRIATMDITVDRRRDPRMASLQVKRRIIWRHDMSIPGPCQGGRPRCGRSSRRAAGTGRCPARRRVSTATG